MSENNEQYSGGVSGMDGEPEIFGDDLSAVDVESGDYLRALEEENRAEEEALSGLEQADKEAAASGAASLRQNITRRRMIERSRARAEESAERLSTYKQLRSAVSTRSILTGTAAGVEIIRNPDTEDREVVLAVMINNWARAYIRYGDMYHPDPITDAEQEEPAVLLRRKREVLSGFLGAKIFFCLNELFESRDKGMYIGTGSRTEAMRRMADRYFSRDDPRIMVGDTIECPVEVVGEHSVVVNAYGVDVVVPQRYLTYRYMTMCSDYYCQDDRLPLTVISVSYDKTGFPVVELNGRTRERQDALDRYSIVNDGSQCICVITNTYRDPKNRNSIRYTGWAQVFNLPVTIDNFSVRDVGYSLKVGDAVRVVVRKHLESGLLACDVLRRLSAINTNAQLRF